MLRARAVPRWSWSAYALGKVTVPARVLSSVGARTWCDVPAAASQNQPVFAWRARARHCALCLSEEGAARELAARAHHAMPVVVGPCGRGGHYTSERPLCFGARPWCAVPAVAPSTSRLSRGMRECATSLAVSREEAQHASVLRARRAALVAVASRTRKGHCTGERPLSFGARTWCDMPAAASQNQPAFAWHARARHCSRCRSREEAQHARFPRARRAALVVVDLRTIRGHCTCKRPLFFGARLWCGVPAVATQN